MPFKYFKYFLIVVGLLSSACSEQAEPAPVEKAYVTNAEYVLGALKLNKASGIAFQVKPIRTTSCEYMYIEFGRKNAEGEWVMTNALFPGKNRLDNFGQDKLMDQVQFAEVDNAGEYGVTALGCKPYGKENKVFRGLFGTFTVESGQLNYIGELALIPVDKEFSDLMIANRSDFAREQVRTFLPELESFFQVNVMERHVPKISKEQQAALDAFEATKKALQPVFEMRKQVVVQYNSAVSDWNNWLDESEGQSIENADAKRKSLKIFRRMEALEDRVDLYDKFIDEGRSAKYVKRYIFLLNDYEKKKATDDMLESADAHDALLTFKRNNP